ncbi:MAG TPA: response regulator [Candidatus Saccharimonadia bacterium]|nr:response regulator [Candidatus Saccharimonadia bacterium]
MAKLMLVEDDNNLREIYEARLQAEGYTIVSARDGEEALVVAKAEKPDLIISDVMMPKISGFEMLDILRNTDGLKDVKVIMLTALGQNDDQQRASKLGADRYLVKSQVTLEDIVKVAHDLLDHKPGEAATVASAAPDPAPTATAPAAAPPAPAPEPVAPAPEPVAEPPVADPATPPAPAAPPADTASESQEEASVEAKIENFVAGASEEPTAPPASEEPSAEAATPAAVEAPGEPVAGDSTPNPDENKVADDKLLDGAVQKLADSAEKAASENKPSVAETATEAPPKEASEESDDKEEPEDKKKPAKPGSVPIAHKKVIEPIDSEPKKDIDALLAIEEAKEAEAEGNDAPAQPVVVDTSAPAKDQPAADGDDNKVDPHSIAL